LQPDVTIFRLYRIQYVGGKLYIGGFIGETGETSWKDPRMRDFRQIWREKNRPVL